MPMVTQESFDAHNSELLRLRAENATLTARVAALTLAVEEGRAIVARFVGYLDGRIIAGDMFYDLVDSLECYVAGSTPAIRAALSEARAAMGEEAEGDANATAK